MSFVALKQSIFSDSIEANFNSVALDIFKHQAEHCNVYKDYLNLLSIDVNSIQNIIDIPFLPIELFKSHKVISSDKPAEIIFESSGTGGDRSKHHVLSTDLYNKSIKKCFEHFYGDINQYDFYALLPSYYNNKNSSLLYMVNEWLKLRGQNANQSYLQKPTDLKQALEKYNRSKIPFIIGVSHSLLDFAEQFSITIPQHIVMETGGMKGMRKEMIREELHQILKKSFGVNQIHSEYGMTELLSQCYSKSEGIFNTPPWMQILIRDVNDPMLLLEDGITGGINIIDLANINSCSFIATQDLGKKVNKNQFEMLGRFDNSDIRGCNLLTTNQ
ncbi:MAG: acyl transferase [Bacteroidia bacterium]|nr:acyl transferase [Bacteroidia bacterium]NNM16355.1 acyl transferase [Bacteroidia bacterium]